MKTVGIERSKNTRSDSHPVIYSIFPKTNLFQQEHGEEPVNEKRKSKEAEIKSISSANKTLDTED